MYRDGQGPAVRRAFCPLLNMLQAASRGQGRPERELRELLLVVAGSALSLAGPWTTRLGSCVASSGRVFRSGFQPGSGGSGGRQVGNLLFERATGVPRSPLLLNMWLSGATRAKHFAAMLLIGDGVMALVRPRRDATAWEAGPKVWRDLMRALADRPGLTRAIGAAQVVGGVLWALQTRDED